MTWDLEKIQELALKCKTRYEFKRLYLNAYRAAIKIKALDKVCSHMPKNASIGKVSPKLKWTLEELKKEASKYSSKNDFKNHAMGAYLAACRKDYIDQICSHMKQFHYSWTNQELAHEAQKYSTRIDFAKLNDNAYQTAQNRKILDLICSHMTRLIREDWTHEDLKKEASKYGTRGEFYKKSNGAYCSANRKKILDDICQHMKKSKGSSLMELELLSEIRKVLPDSKKIKFYKIEIPTKPHIKRFELDIVNQKMKKAVEFDGTYHHSFKCMRKNKRKKLWSDEDIRNYHEIKDSYSFLYQGIQVLHIKEEDWTRNKDYCIKLSKAWLSNECSVYPKPLPLLDL